MSTISQSLTLHSLARTAFSLRFSGLQTDLDATLTMSEANPDVVLAMQDRLILRLEGWVDSVADLHMLTKTDIDIFRHTLSTNRKVYRMRALEIHNVDITVKERAAINRALKLTIRKISSVVPGPRERLDSISVLH